MEFTRIDNITGAIISTESYCEQADVDLNQRDGTTLFEGFFDGDKYVFDFKLYQFVSKDTSGQIADQRKTIRVSLITSTDWMTWRHRDQIEAGLPQSLTAGQYSELLAYRQALRDWPVSGDYSEAFPMRPGWMS